MFDFLIKGIRPQILLCKYRYSRLFIPWEIHSDEDIDDRIILEKSRALPILQNLILVFTFFFYI